jgi:hypothetical protein
MYDGYGYDFPVVSMKEEQPTVDLVTAEPGATVVDDETLYEAVGPDTYDVGSRVGSLTIVHWKSSTGERVLFTAHFEFDDGEIVALTGVVPGRGSWQGTGRVGYSGGTGKFADRRGDIAVKSSNPKYWG